MSLQTTPLSSLSCILGILFVLTATTAIDPRCLISHCTNGGTCYIDPSTNKTSCFCPAGFSGPNCSKIDLCAGNDCSNGGTCRPVVTNLTYHCDCLPGFTGHNCSALVDACVGNPCKNGDCIDYHSNYKCKCFPGYAGAECDQYVGLCAGSPCNHLDQKAKCSQDGSAYQCRCSSHDYFGLNCESSSKNCHEEEESYCICTVNNLPVKFPIPSPDPYDGINIRDIIYTLLGILVGWLLGTILLHCCCSCCFSGVNNRASEPAKPWLRPESAESNNTVTSDLSSTSSNFPRSNKVAPSDIAVMPIMANDPISSSQGVVSKEMLHKKEVMITNVYRAAFVDELSHNVSSRKASDTYLTGKKDW